MVSKSDWQPDARERAETTRQPKGLERAVRLRQMVKTLENRWVEVTGKPAAELDPYGALARRLQHVIDENRGCADMVELVSLRNIEYMKTKFSPEALWSMSFDMDRRQVVHGLPADTPEAWSWALWSEKEQLAQTKYARPARECMAEWCSAVDDGDPARAARAVEILGKLRDEQLVDEVAF